MDAIRAKSILMTDYASFLTDSWLAPFGFSLGSPRDSAMRGSHISIRHIDGYRINRALIEEMNVIPDFREPDNLRLGFAPLYLSFCRYLDFTPRRLHFVSISDLKQTGLYQNLDALPPLHEARTIRDILAFRPIERGGVYVILINSAPDGTELEFHAQKMIAEPRKGKREPIEFVRDWSAAPSMPARLVPETKSLYRQFGGDPITIRVNGKIQKRRLFIGGLDKQSETRPNVDAVLNLSESPSRWLTAGAPDPRDRWENKGEGRDGMSLEEIAAEAMWTLERLNQGQRVLVHCAAGMNRSSTICCAALILQEKLSAEQALARVRERHPWARPDSLHWLKLRWLASAIQKT
jgi:hypothetical protein